MGSGEARPAASRRPSPTNKTAKLNLCAAYNPSNRSSNQHTNERLRNGCVIFTTAVGCAHNRDLINIPKESWMQKSNLFPRAEECDFSSWHHTNHGHGWRAAMIKINARCWSPLSPNVTVYIIIYELLYCGATFLPLTAICPQWGIARVFY